MDNNETLGACLKEALYEGFIEEKDSVIESVRKKYADEQKESDITAVIKSYIYLDLEDDRIYKLLHVFFDINDFSYMEKEIKSARLENRIENKVKELVDYCNKKGIQMTNSIRFKKMIRRNEDMLEWKPQRIIDHANKN